MAFSDIFRKLCKNLLSILDERSVASAVGSLSTASANKLAQMQVGTSFPHANDILFTQSQAAEFASMGVPVASHHISNAPAWKEQVDSNARGVSNGIMNGRLWQQHVNPANCDVKTDPNCRYMVPYFYADGTTTAVRANIETAMAAIEAKTCLQFQYLSNPRSFTYVNKKKLRVVTNLNLCSSYVGANLIEQDIYLSHHSALDCGLNARAVEHEILHAVGLYHENQRFDYDKFIEYDWTNIDPLLSNAEINSDYGVIPEEMSNTFDSMYDQESIMHLTSGTNSKVDTCTAVGSTFADGCLFLKHDNLGGAASGAIIEADLGENRAFADTGYREGSLTDEDAWQINNMYGCTAYLEKYMFTCSADASTQFGARAAGYSAHVMSHWKGSDGVCDTTGGHNICPDVMDNANNDNPDALDEDTNITCGLCGRGNHDCAADANCTNPAGVVVCDCLNNTATWTARTGPTVADAGVWGATSTTSDRRSGNGFSLISGGTGCTDVNECIDSQTCYDQTADVRLQCINHDGGFECVCPAGQTHPPVNPEDPLLHLQTCIDLDECATEQHGCPAHMECLNRFCETGLNNEDVTTNGAVIKFGEPCFYGEANTAKSYECACKTQGGTTGSATYGTCENINQCAGTDFAAGSNVMGTTVCKMCPNGQMTDDCNAVGVYDAGLMCFDKDDTMDVVGYQCRCPLGAEMVYYTTDFFAELDEANDNAVNGDMMAIVNAVNTMPMANWFYADYSTPATPTYIAPSAWDPSGVHKTKIENGEIKILIPKSYHGEDGDVGPTAPYNADGTLKETASDLDPILAVAANLPKWFFTVSWDDTIKQWSSEYPAQCVDVDMCPRTKCPG